MTGSNDLNGNNEKKDPFHLLKVRFSLEIQDKG
jgi:hypothetical protein